MQQKTKNLCKNLTEIVIATTIAIAKLEQKKNMYAKVLGICLIYYFGLLYATSVVLVFCYFFILKFFNCHFVSPSIFFSFSLYLYLSNFPLSLIFSIYLSIYLSFFFSLSLSFSLSPFFIFPFELFFPVCLNFLCLSPFFLPPLLFP